MDKSKRKNLQSGLRHTMNEHGPDVKVKIRAQDVLDLIAEIERLEPLAAKESLRELMGDKSSPFSTIFGKT